MFKPAIFLDRDGTLNVEKEYLHRIEDWEWIAGAVEAIKLINQFGYLAIVVTNQAGIARGYYCEEDVKILHQSVDRILSVNNAWIDAYYYCPHHPEYGQINDCLCRKPGIQMLLSAQRDFDIDFSKSYLIGDKVIDTIAAMRAGVKPILVKTGYGEVEQSYVNENVIVAANVFSAVKSIVCQSVNNYRTRNAV